MHLITRVRFELPVGFDARILIALCCEDVVWQDHRVLSGSIVGETGTTHLGGVLGDSCFYGSFSRHDGESPERMIEALRRRLDWVSRSRLGGEGAVEVRPAEVPYRMAA